MNRVYDERINWKNYPSTDTAVNAANLNKMDYALYEIDGRVVDLAKGEERAEESAEDAEAWAVGTRDGKAVSSSDATYHNNSKYYATLAGTRASNASTYANNASRSAVSASDYASAASNSAAAAAQSAAEAETYAQGGLAYKGSITFAQIPTSGMKSGWMYNMEEDFTTDSRFQEGEGIKVRAGTNIAWNGSKWDVLAVGGVDADSSFSTTSQNAVQNKVITAALANGNISFGIDANGNYGYKKAGADTVTPFKSDPVLQAKSADPSTEIVYVKPDSGYDGLSEVKVNAVSLQTKTTTVTPAANWSGQNTSAATITPDSGYAGMSQANVSVPMLRDYTLFTASTVETPGTVYNGNTAQSNSTKMLRIKPSKDGMSYTNSYLSLGPSSYMGDATAADVRSGKTFSSSAGIQVTGTATIGGTYQSKIAYPSTSTQYITPDSGYDALSQVQVSAITPQRSSISQTIGPYGTTLSYGWYPSNFTIYGKGNLNFKSGTFTNSTNLTYYCDAAGSGFYVMVTMTSSNASTYVRVSYNGTVYTPSAAYNTQVSASLTIINFGIAPIAGATITVYSKNSTTRYGAIVSDAPLAEIVEVVPEVVVAEDP